MVERVPERRSRGFLTPVLAGLLLIGGLIAVIAFRAEVWRFVKWIGSGIQDLFTGWVPDHPKQFSAIVGFAIVAFVLNWIAHVRGRFRAWVFAIVVEVGLWLLFWYGPGIPSLNELFGLNLPGLTWTEVVVSAIVVIAVTGALFWFLEMREEWRKYRRQHHVDDDA
jgi:hypothetical protein